MKKTLSLVFLLSLSTALFASYKECPSLSVMKSGIDFTQAGTVPAKMPTYEEFSGKKDPAWIQGDGHGKGDFWVVISDKPRTSDNPKGSGGYFLSGMVVGGKSNDDRSVVLARAQALLESSTFNPVNEGGKNYVENWTSGPYEYEMCLYRGDAGTGAMSMKANTVIAELKAHKPASELH